MKRIDYFSIIQKHFVPGSRAEMIYVAHVSLVAQFALEIGKDIGLSDEQLLFIEEASMLHDIGISKVHAPSIDCFGKAQYIEHGYIGRKILEEEGLFAHALVCERHTGSGMTAEEIVDQRLPLPHRDMLPFSIEEKIICYADLFYTKKPQLLFVKKNALDVAASLKKFPGKSFERFNDLEKEILQK